MSAQKHATPMFYCAVALAFASLPAVATAQSRVDPALAVYIAKIRSVDNHSHANSVAPADSDADALALDGVPFELPVPLRPDSPVWLAAYEALYRYPHADLSEPHMNEFRGSMQGVAKREGSNFPTWVLDQVGTEVLLANRIAMGPGLTTRRFRWVSYADALLLPLSNKTEAAMSFDRQKLYPLEDKLFRRYLSDLKLSRTPTTLESYLTTVVTPTLESQRRAGCVGVKFEAAYLRSLDFGESSLAAASAIYAKYSEGGEPSHDEYKTLQDFLFRYIAREAGRLGMAVHIHSFEAFGNAYSVSGADPLLLESAFNDPALSKTNFVIVHGGGIFAAHTAAMLWKPNVYADVSMMTLAYTPANLANILRGWLSQFPGKVLFGSDAFGFGPDMGWELSAWIASKNARTALAMALTDMMRNGEVTRTRAEEIARMVMRTNASKLYGLGLN
jgi:uncharacterized protein